MHKRAFLFALIIVLVSLSPDLCPEAAAAPVSLSDPSHPHNLSITSNAGQFKALYETRICIFCHTPHTARANTPLWNRHDTLISDITDPGPWAIYGGDGASINIDEIPAAQYAVLDRTDVYPNGATRFCLSCHDGKTAIGWTVSEGEIEMDNANPWKGRWMHEDGRVWIDKTKFDTMHPVSFVYDATVIAALGAGFAAPDQTRGSTKARLDGQSRMQCTTCHDPHVWDPAEPKPPMWRNFGGAPGVREEETCNECHVSAPGNVPHGA